MFPRPFQHITSSVVVHNEVVKGLNKVPLAVPRLLFLEKESLAAVGRKDTVNFQQ